MAFNLNLIPSRHAPFLPCLERIGAGSTGTVWATKGNLRSGLVIKREDGPFAAEGWSLRNEFDVNVRVLKAFKQYVRDHASPIRFAIPLCYAYIDANDAAWAAFLPHLPEGSEPCSAVIGEKIPPFSKSARRDLATFFVPQKHRARVLWDPANEHCLIRPYLGRRKTDIVRGGRTSRMGRPYLFTMRNMVLHIEELDALGLGIAHYVVALADALAFLLWVARIDADGVEFVLAPPRQHVNGGPRASNPLEACAQWSTCETLGDHVLWVLDFDRCNGLRMDRRGARRAAECFLRNDPYFPRPGRPDRQDQLLWSMFRDRFLVHSAQLLRNQDPGVQELPKLFVDDVAKLVRARQRRRRLSVGAWVESTQPAPLDDKDPLR
ncbi:hypothetical protein VTK26DRAFT_8209 [Humicola hyalothermophila]